MKTDSEIAHEAKLNLIGDIARQINIPEDDDCCFFLFHEYIDFCTPY